MGMSFAGGGNEKDKIKNGNDRHGNGNGGRTGMTEQEWSRDIHNLYENLRRTTRTLIILTMPSRSTNRI